MVYARISTFILLLLLGAPVHALDDLRDKFNLDVMYHYGRAERATTFTNINFLTRQGAMLQGDYYQPIGLFWGWYARGDLAYAIWESPGLTGLSVEETIPWQLLGGLRFSMGQLKNVQLFFGLGGSSEHFWRAEGANLYRPVAKASVRAHAGFSWRFVSLVGATARFTARYYLPVTQIKHDSLTIRHKGVLDGTLRLRTNYKSSWSMYAGIRFEDFGTTDESVTYFITRIYAGVGFDIDVDY